tara:strand:- start:1729 stop:1920 length:192 start_codon:yes stop_codon:yes gene_type:complete
MMAFNPWEIKEYKNQKKLNELEEELFQVQSKEFTDSMTSSETHYYMEREKLLKKQIAEIKEVG